MKKNFKLKALVVLFTVIYQTFPTEPTHDRLLELHNFYESKYCSGNVGNESGIQ